MKLILRCVFVVLLVGNHQNLKSESDNQQGNHGNKITMISGCVQLAASIVSKSYAHFAQEKADYNLQEDVIDNPYKKMIYESMQTIEQLFDDANKHDNPSAQIRSLILLCRVQVPEWYVKSFNKGLEVLYRICFDEQGNFVDASSLGGIRFIFKEYCHKAPGSWQQIAQISDWWWRNKKPYPMTAKYYAHTCTDHNEDLLNMIAVSNVQDFVYLSYVMQKNGSKSARKIYNYQVSRFLKSSMHDINNQD